MCENKLLFMLSWTTKSRLLQFRFRVLLGMMGKVVILIIIVIVKYSMKLKRIKLMPCWWTDRKTMIYQIKEKETKYPHFCWHMHIILWCNISCLQNITHTSPSFFHEPCTWDWCFLKASEIITSQLIFVYGLSAWLLKLSMITSAGTTDKASKEPFGKNLYNQEYWASM